MKLDRATPDAIGHRVTENGTYICQNCLYLWPEGKGLEPIYDKDQVGDVQCDLCGRSLRVPEEKAN